MFGLAKLYALCDFEDGYSETFLVTCKSMEIHLTENPKYAKAFREHGKCVKKLFYKY